MLQKLDILVSVSLRCQKENYTKNGEVNLFGLSIGPLPTEFLPPKSIETKKASPRSFTKKNVDANPLEPTLEVFQYTELQDLKKDFKHQPPLDCFN